MIRRNVVVTVGLYIAGLAGVGCYTMTVSGGGYPAEISWEVLEGDVRMVTGSGPGTEEVCLGAPTTAPTTSWPTMTSRPTPERSMDYIALSTLYIGMLPRNTTQHFRVRPYTVIAAPHVCIPTWCLTNSLTHPPRLRQ